MVSQLPLDSDQNAKWKILIIDDDEDDFFIVQSMLKEARGRKFDVHWESTFEAGRNELSSNAYHAVLVDYDLGAHSGIELIREASERGYAAPLILFTGRGSYEVDVEAMEAGATLYLSKGEATPLLLERVIRYAVELKQKELSLRASEAQLRQSNTQYRQAEQALLSAEERFAKAFHSSPAALAITRVSDGRYIEANESLCQLTGYQRSEIIGHTALELGLYASPAQRAELLRLIKERGNVRDYEVEARTKTGSRRILLGAFDQIELDHEPCLLATLIDITERKLAEQALVKNESRLREFVENTHDSYFSLDRAWRVTYANRRYAEIMGVSAQEMTGKNFWELFPQYLGTDVEQVYRKAMTERVQLDFQRRGVYTNGIYDVSVYPTEEGLAVFSIDRTAEHHQQQLLENERAQLAAVLSALPVGVWITDIDGRVVGKNEYSNRIWAGAAPMSESVAKYVEYEMLDPVTRKPRPLEEYPLVRVLNTGQPVEPQENLIRRFDNNYSFTVVSAAPIRDRNGRMTGAVAIMLDVNERKQAEELLHGIIDNANAAVYAKDLEGRYILSNRYHAALLGQTPETMPGKTDADFLSAAPRSDEYVNNDQLVVARGQPVEFEEVAPGTDGTQHTYLSVKFPLRDLNGRIFAVCGISADITERKRAERDLKEREETLRAYARELEAILDAVPAYMWITHDPQGQQMTGNSAVYELLNLPPGENLSITGSASSKVGHLKVLRNGEEISNEALPVQQVAVTGVPLRDYEVDLVLEDGQTRHLLGNVSPLMNEDGQPAGAVSAFIDVTAMKTVQRKLEENENRFRVALASAPITVYTTNCDLRITWMHDFHPGFDPERAIGMRFDEIFPGEYGALVTGIHKEVIRTGQPQQGEIETSLDGEPVYYTYYIDPIRGESGEISGLACAGFDITRRREAEKALFEREEMLELALASANAGAWTWDLRTDTQVWSDEFYRIYGYAPGEVEASWRFGKAHTHPEDHKLVDDAVEEAISQGKKVEILHRVIWEDGSVHWIRGLARVAYDAHGKPERMTGIVLDVTPQKQEEEMLAHYAAKLAQSNQELEQFAFVASHDLQEPLRKIIMFGNNLRDHLSEGTDEEAENYLSRMQNAAERMRVMIDGLLELSRISSRGGNFAQVDLNRVVHDAISDLEVPIRAANARITVGDLPTVEADEHQVRRLFQNLIGNAIKFQKPGAPPAVSVSGTVDLTGNPPMAEIRIEDHGIGFDQAQAERIFQPFQRLHGRTKYDGTGLGLAICKKIVERHQGRIEARGEPGQGAAFVVFLPIKQEV